MAAYLPKVFLTVEESVLATGLPYEEAHLQATGMTPHAITALVAKAQEVPEDLLLPSPDWETPPVSWTSTLRRAAIVHLTHAKVTNLFGPESPQIVAHFATTMTRIAETTGLPTSDVESILADAMLKAMEFGSQVDLDRGCFALDGTTSPLTMRHSFIGLCIERVERNFGVGSGFH